MASAFIYRWSIRDAMAFMVISSRPKGMSGMSSRGDMGLALMCWMATDTGESPSKGRRPVSIS